mgnify:CR=1 FL=1
MHSAPVLTVGELTSVLILVVVLGVLVLTVVVLVVVLVTGVVAVDELEHAHDDGTGLGGYDMANVAKNVINKANGGAQRPSLELQNSVVSQVKDWSSVPKNRTVAIKTCYATGIIMGMADGKFHGEVMNWTPVTFSSGLNVPFSKPATMPSLAHSVTSL